MSLKHIAEEAGVSISTVSRVLNKSHTASASKELQQKIWEIAKRQNYVPNASARNLKNKNNGNPEAPKYLCCMYACSPQEVKDDPFFPTLVESVEKEAFKHNFLLTHTFFASALDNPMTASTLSNTELDSLVILGRFQLDLYKRIKPYFKNIICISLNALDIPCDQIICNGFELALDGVRHLKQLGNHNIGFIGSDEARYRGYLAALQESNLPEKPEYIVNDAVLSMDGGYQGMLKLLDNSKDLTAVFCANDMVSIGALRACKERGIHVPEDISLLGINDIENIQYTSPMLSSMHVPLDEMGRTAISILLDRIRGTHKLNVKLFFPYRIVNRASCKKIKQER